jgi:hypothetical protein
VGRRSGRAGEPVDADNSLDELALLVGLKGFDFQVLDPPELVPVLSALAERPRRGAGASDPA